MADEPLVRSVKPDGDAVRLAGNSAPGSQYYVEGVAGEVYIGFSKDGVTSRTRKVSAGQLKQYTIPGRGKGNELWAWVPSTATTTGKVRLSEPDPHENLVDGSSVVIQDQGGAASTPYSADAAEVGEAGIDVSSGPRSWTLPTPRRPTEIAIVALSEDAAANSVDFQVFVGMREIQRWYDTGDNPTEDWDGDGTDEKYIDVVRRVVTESDIVVEIPQQANVTDIELQVLIT
jgi:hypothetical protein